MLLAVSEKQSTFISTSPSFGSGTAVSVISVFASSSRATSKSILLAFIVPSLLFRWRSTPLG